MQLFNLNWGKYRALEAENKPKNKLNLG